MYSYRGLEQRSARHFNLVKVNGSNPLPATIIFLIYTIMNILNLSIKQKFFDEIIAGTKKQETREIRPTNAKKYFRYELNGKEYDDPDLIPSEDEEAGSVNLVPVRYDAIKFLTGEYKGKRPYAIVEVTDSVIELFQDEEGNDITYQYKGKEYIAAQIVYDLGKVIEIELYNH